MVLFKQVGKYLRRLIKSYWPPLQQLAIWLANKFIFLPFTALRMSIILHHITPLYWTNSFETHRALHCIDCMPLHIMQLTAIQCKYNFFIACIVYLRWCSAIALRCNLLHYVKLWRCNSYQTSDTKNPNFSDASKFLTSERAWGQFIWGFSCNISKTKDQWCNFTAIVYLGF